MQNLDELSSFYKENNFKRCLAKQLLNMFKLWCERGISPSARTSSKSQSSSKEQQNEPQEG